MSKPLRTEHALMPPLPDTLCICDRCKRGILIFLGQGDGHPYVQTAARPESWCYTCSDGGAPGVPYTRMASTEER